jgi:hypothetical protein
MSTADRMERQFFINLISLVNEVQGKVILPSQMNEKKKSAWIKQTSNPRQRKDALALV